MKNDELPIVYGPAPADIETINVDETDLTDLPAATDLPVKPGQ